MHFDLALFDRSTYLVSPALFQIPPRLILAVHLLVQVEPEELLGRVIVVLTRQGKDGVDGSRRGDFEGKGVGAANKARRSGEAR